MLQNYDIASLLRTVLIAGPGSILNRREQCTFVFLQLDFLPEIVDIVFLKFTL